MFWRYFIWDDLYCAMCIPVQIFLCATKWRHYRVLNLKLRIFDFLRTYYCDFLNNV